jgi:hypothetical protein
MNISPNEAEESLAAIQTVAQKTRHSIASGGTTITLIVTGVIWLVGFLTTQFMPGPREASWAQSWVPSSASEWVSVSAVRRQSRWQSELASSGCF